MCGRFGNNLLTRSALCGDNTLTLQLVVPFVLNTPVAQFTHTISEVL